MPPIPDPETTIGRTTTHFLLVASGAGLFIATWPLAVAVRPFIRRRIHTRIHKLENPQTESSLADPAPVTLTHYLNLICFALVFLDLLFILLFEYHAFAVHHQYEQAHGPDMIMVYCLFGLFHTIATYSYALVVLDRFRIFRELIRYPIRTLWIMHSLAILALCTSFVLWSIMLAMRLQTPDEARPESTWEAFRWTIQYFSFTMDTYVVARISWCYFRLPPSANAAAVPPSKFRLSIKAQIVLLIVLMVLLEALTAVIGWNRGHGIALLSSIGSYNFFIVHVCLGLIILVKLKTAVSEQTRSRNDIIALQDSVGIPRSV